MQITNNNRMDEDNNYMMQMQILSNNCIRIFTLILDLVIFRCYWTGYGEGEVCTCTLY